MALPYVDTIDVQGQCAQRLCGDVKPPTGVGLYGVHVGKTARAEARQTDFGAFSARELT